MLLSAFSCCFVSICFIFWFISIWRLPANLSHRVVWSCLLDYSFRLIIIGPYSLLYSAYPALTFRVASPACFSPSILFRFFSYSFLGWSQMASLPCWVVWSLLFIYSALLASLLLRVVWSMRAPLTSVIFFSIYSCLSLAFFTFF